MKVKAQEKKPQHFSAEKQNEVISFCSYFLRYRIAFVSFGHDEMVTQISTTQSQTPQDREFLEINSENH